jgi:ATP-binding cassette subfamily B protein
MKKIFPVLKPFMAAFVLAIVIKGIAAITDIMIPLYMGRLIDHGILTGSVQAILRLAGIMLALTAVTLAGNIWSHNISAKAVQAMGENLRNTIYARIQRLTVADVDRFQTGSLITRITNDVEQVQRALHMMARLFVRAPIMAVGGVFLSLLIDPWLTAVVFAGMAVTCGISWWVYRVTRPIFRKVQRNIDKLTTILREDLAGIRVIKSFDKAEHEINRFDAQSGEIMANELKAGTYNAFVWPTIALTNSLTVAAILFAAYWRMQGSENLPGIAIGEVVTVVNYVNQILMAMSQVPRIFMLFSRANTSAVRVSEVIETEAATVYGTETAPLSEETVLELKNVGFNYENSKKEVLSDINFSVGKGETVGIIGGTGSGKTTLLHLILRLYEPTRGEIYLQGRRIDTYTKDYMRGTVTAALQQYNIFAMGIGENITLDRPHDPSTLQRAAEAAQIMDFIQQADGRFDYPVTQTGTNISGGQKQRVSVARTLYREAELTVLDDVSSSLDYKTDLLLRTALRTAYKGKSVLIIAQRISSVLSADKIIVLRKGKIAGIGTHDELMANCGTYREIAQTQGIIDCGVTANG